METRNNIPLNAEMMIKVCGMSQAENIHNVSALYPMMMGFIFWEGSKRNAINLDANEVKNLPDYVHKVAVFVNEEISKIEETCNKYDIDIVQLHGDESPAACKELKDKGYTVFKAIGIGEESDLDDLDKYKESIDLFVFDTKSDKRGGTGRKFKHSILDSYKLDVPYLLSGGIGPKDVKNIINNLRLGMVGIDINSKFESKPGIKDINLLTNFILELRKYNEYEPNRIPFFKKEK